MSRVSKNKLFFFCAISLLFLPIVVSARPADPYRFPKVEPLRLPMENVAPNYSNNINVSDEQASTTEQNNSEVGIQENEKTDLENLNAGKIIKNNSFEKTPKALFIIFIILIFGAVLGALFYIYRKKIKKSPRD